VSEKLHSGFTSGVIHVNQQNLFLIRHKLISIVAS
jgi:hypothetical protein